MSIVSQIRQVMSLVKQEYLDINPDRILFHKLLQEPNLRDPNIYDIIICAVQQKVPKASNIIPCKEMSSL